MADGAPTILCVGPSHKTASLAARERFALVGERAQRLTLELHEHADVLEVVNVATCNRSELYLAVTDVDRVLPTVVATFARVADADVDELSTMLAVRVEDVAVAHLLRVAAGVESVVVGEAEIQGQLKQALEAAHGSRTCGALLDRLFRTALEVGKRARSETAIGSGRASIGSIAAELVTHRLGALHEATVLVVGAGMMGNLAARSLRARGDVAIVVANRDAARAASVAEQCQGTVVTLDEVDAQLAQCDAVIASTSATTPLVTRERVAAAVAQRAGKPLVLVDLAVPRNIEPAVGELPGCYLYDLDDLEHVVSETMQQRTGELAAVEAITQQASSEYSEWRRSRDAVPAIAAMRHAAEQIRAREYARFERRLAHLAPEDRSRVEQLTRSIVNRVLHAPTVALRSGAATVEGAAAEPPPVGLEL